MVEKKRPSLSTYLQHDLKQPTVVCVDHIIIMNEWPVGLLFGNSQYVSFIDTAVKLGDTKVSQKVTLNIYLIWNFAFLYTSFVDCSN